MWETHEGATTGLLADRGLPTALPSWFNRDMASIENDTAKGRHDLEPFWPSRQHHDFDRCCRRVRNASAL
ncbi:hypothetical protein OG309_10640 [Streptomyces sp. NBC_01268]|nr:hypothetical protein [Streptomyces sp. NBC_01268]